MSADEVLGTISATTPRSAVAHWASTLSETSVQGAFDPAGVRVVRLSTSQLITFIVTATEAQILQGPPLIPPAQCSGVYLLR